MQKSPESQRDAENAQAAEGELPDAKLAEISGGGSLGGLLNSVDTSVNLNLLQLQNAANRAAETAANLTNAINTSANTAANSKNIG